MKTYSKFLLTNTHFISNYKCNTYADSYFNEKKYLPGGDY